MKILMVVVVLVLIYLLIKITTLPMRLLFKLLINSGIGLVTLILLNILGEGIGFYIAINPVSVLIVGTLGIPGIGFLMIYTYFLQ